MPTNVDPRHAADIEDAWRIISELLRTGKARLANGDMLVPESGELIGLVKWLASLKPPQRRTVARPEDFTLKKTQEKEGGS